MDRGTPTSVFRDERSLSKRAATLKIDGWGGDAEPLHSRPGSSAQEIQAHPIAIQGTPQIVLEDEPAG